MLFRKVAGQPFENVPGRLHTPLTIGSGFTPFKPLGAEAAIRVLQANGVLLKIFEEPLGTFPLTVKRFAFIDAILHGIGQAHQAMGSATGGTDHRLCNLFFNQTGDTPFLPVIAHPFCVGRQVMTEPNQLECQFGTGSTGRLLVGNQVIHREALPLNANFEFRGNIRLSEH